MLRHYLRCEAVSLDDGLVAVLPFPSISWSTAQSVDHSTFPKLLANANLTNAIHQSRAFDAGNPSSDSTYLPVHC